MYTISLLRLAQKELFKLPAGIQAALIKALDELEVYGHELREPVVRDIGKGLKGVLRRNPRFFRHLSFSPATSASRSIISLLLWKM